MARKKTTKTTKNDPPADTKEALLRRNLEDILEEYQRLIFMLATQHVREGSVELEDLIEEGRLGVIEAYKLYTDPKPNQKVPSYSFRQRCLYNIRARIFYYCLDNVSPFKTPAYIQRGCMHVGQVYKILGNQNVAEELFARPGPATEQEILDFLYDDTERIPNYPLHEIEQMITKDKSDKHFKEILDGVLHHRNGSRHAVVKSSLTDIGKLLHIKEKLYFCAQQNSMKYKRVIDLILQARVIVQDIDSGIQKSSSHNTEKEVMKRELMHRGRDILGEQYFDIFCDSVLRDMPYGEIAEKYELKKSKVSDIVNKCIAILRKDEVFQEFYKDLIP